MMRPSVKLDRGAGRRLGADPGQHLDAVNFQAPRGVVGEVGGKGGQDAVGIFDQVEADLVVAYVGIIFERAADQLAGLRHGLDAGEAGAHHDEGQQRRFTSGSSVTSAVSRQPITWVRSRCASARSFMVSACSGRPGKRLRSTPVPSAITSSS